MTQNSDPTNNEVAEFDYVLKKTFEQQKISKDQLLTRKHFPLHTHIHFSHISQKYEKIFKFTYK